MANFQKIKATAMAIPESIRLLKRIKERLDKLMSDPRTPIEIRSTDLYDCIVRDRELGASFPEKATFNRFLRKQYDQGLLKQIIPNCRVDTSNHRFYQWYFFRELNKSPYAGKGVITTETNFRYHSYHIRVVASNGVKLRSAQEREIYEKLIKCEFLKIDYEFPISKFGETKFTDFRITNLINQKIYIWEHFGMTNSSQYLDLMPEKIKWYRENGYKTVENGGNLIYTIFSDRHNFRKDIDRYILLIKQ